MKLSTTLAFLLSSSQLILHFLPSSQPAQTHYCAYLGTVMPKQEIIFEIMSSGSEFFSGILATLA